MKIAVAANDDRGLEATISEHFGRCPYYILVEVDEKELGKTEAVKSPFYRNHGEPGEVPNFIKSLDAQVIISGGMGPKAIGFFQQLGIQTVTGVSGTVGEAIKAYMSGAIEGALPCDAHDSGHHIEAHGDSDVGQLRKEISALREDLAAATEKLKKLETEKKGAE